VNRITFVRRADFVPEVGNLETRGLSTPVSTFAPNLALTFRPGSIDQKTPLAHDHADGA